MESFQDSINCLYLQSLFSEIPFIFNQVLCESIVLSGINSVQDGMLDQNVTQQITTNPSLIPLPLTYPQFFNLFEIRQNGYSISLDEQGDLSGSSIITRLGPNIGFKEYLNKCSRDLYSISSRGLCDSVLSGWGYEKETVNEVVEGLNVMSSSYQNDDLEDEEW
eukprot:TRINITY_DN31417_c0_g1_i1.p3 TRINITY_DN31417_c0_g1~~TRINITY_DN31417_c0_g1_i1.p3  ORF type:complete len:164 (-),score=20.08 TRINITY_DN31417_c0_g1_i1:132-623(-)